MTERHVFIATTVEQLVPAVDAARSAGIGADGISLVARSDIELEAFPDELKLTETDFLPAAARGAGLGAATGTLAGLVAAAFPPLGLTLAGAMIGGGVAGALVGSWSSAIVGAAVPEGVRRHFEEEIEAGRILVVIDATGEQHARIAPVFADHGLRELDYREGITGTDGE